MAKPAPSPLQNYKGYLKEGLLYPACLFARPHIGLQKFIIFGMPRSGTTLLVNLLDSHPQIHCEGELWIHPLLFPRRYVNCRARLCKKPFFGFKLMIDHFETQKIEHPESYLRRLHENGYRMISLKRQNLYRAALSSLYGSFLGRFHLTQSEAGAQRRRMEVNPQELVRKIERFDRLNRRHSEVLGTLPRLEINYEDNLVHAANHQNTIDQICAYLEVAPYRATTNLVKMASEDVEGFVANADELEAYVRTTPYAGFVA